MHPPHIGKIADALLWIVVITAPLAGGSSNLLVLPILAVVTAAAYAAALFSLRESGRALHVFGLAIGCLLLAAFSALQALPLPFPWLEAISPRAADLRAFVEVDRHRAPLSYEPGSTIRESAKLLLYMMVALVACERVRSRRGCEVVVVPVAIAGLAAAGLALIHRALGIDRIFGVLPTMGSTSAMWTTFANPNHAAGFMALASLSSVGLALSDRARHRRAGFLIAAVLSGLVSVLGLSRGGLVALAFGYAILALLLALSRANRRRGLRYATPALLVMCLLLPLAGILLRLDGIIGEVRGTLLDRAGISEKLAGARDVLPMALDHRWLGIGRGAFISVYPQYKTSPLRLTFAYPENLFAQLVSEWGFVVGGLALLGLLTALIVRLGRARSTAALGALVGVTALALQNMVDFSLELPGVAVPVAALLGGAGADRVWRIRLSLASRLTSGVVLGFPILLLFAATAGAVLGGDVIEDVRRLEGAALARGATHPLDPEAPGPAEPMSFSEARALAARHPANPLVAVQVAYLAETGTPPDLEEAVRWTNRTLYLAPTYADGHLTAGRLLVRTGHRSQGFLELRRAWELSDGLLWPTLIDQVLLLARSPDDVLAAVPRRDPELDIVDEWSLARCVLYVAGTRRAEWARSLASRFEEVDSIPEGALSVVARAALSTGELRIAERVLERIRRKEPDDLEAALLLLRVLNERGARADMKALIDRMLATEGVDPVPFLRARFQWALGERDTATAHASLAELDRRLPPTHLHQAEIARLELALAKLQGNPSRTVEALDRAVGLAPEDLDLRLERAQVLKTIRRWREARIDVEFVLARDPKQPVAHALLESLSASE